MSRTAAMVSPGPDVNVVVAEHEAALAAVPEQRKAAEPDPRRVATRAHPSGN